MRARGRKSAIVGEELVRPDGEAVAHLYEVLECGHRRRGVYNKEGEPSTAAGSPVTYRICRGCITGAPKGPPGEVLG